MVAIKQNSSKSKEKGKVVVGCSKAQQQLQREETDGTLREWEECIKNNMYNKSQKVAMKRGSVFGILTFFFTLKKLIVE